MLKLILTPSVIIAVLNLLKYAIKCYTQYQELKLLVASGKERVAVTKNGVSYKN